MVETQNTTMLNREIKNRKLKENYRGKWGYRVNEK